MHITRSSVIIFNQNGINNFLSDGDRHARARSSKLLLDPRDCSRHSAQIKIFIWLISRDGTWQAWYYRNLEIFKIAKLQAKMS